MKLLKILCLTVLAIPTIEAVQIENRSSSNAYVSQITTLRNNGLGEVPYIEQTAVIVVPGQTIDISTYGDYYQKVTNVTFNHGNSVFEIRVKPNDSHAKITINDDGSVNTTEGVGMSRHSQNITRQIQIQGTRML